MVHERAAITAKPAPAHPEILGELLGRRVERQYEDLAMAVLEKKVRRRVGPALVVDVHRRRGLGVAVHDDERDAALAKRCDLGMALVEADDHEPVHGSGGDRALERPAQRRHCKEPDAALVGDAADALEERGEERIGEDRRDRLRKEHAEDPDPL